MQTSTPQPQPSKTSAARPAPPGSAPVRTTAFLDSSDLLREPAALRARAERHGYLLFRGLLPAAAVLDVRRRFLAILDRHGWLASGHPLEDGVADLRAFAAEPPEETAFCGVGVSAAAYAAVQRVRQFHELAHHPRLLEVFRTLLGTEVLPHPRNIARLVLCGPGAVPTPPHQDFIHVQGSARTWTAWLPLGDCPRELGALSVLDGSHREGLLSYKRAAGAGGLEAYLCELDLAWAQGDLAAGDVLAFSSQTVHRALPHRLRERVRLSCDFRYQPLHDEIDDGALQVHCGVLDWEQVYDGWPAGGIQWYWRDLPLRRSQWDESLRWQRDRIC